MPLSKNQKEEIYSILARTLRAKFKSYKPETNSMPFHTRLLGKDRLALFSFIQSLNTTFGTSIFEPVAVAIAAQKFKQAEKQQTAGSQISSQAQLTIQKILDDLHTGATSPNSESEIEAIRKVCQAGEIKTVKLTKVDIKLIDQKDKILLIDLKTAKPNTNEFKQFKRTLLEWVAVTLCDNPKVVVNSLIAIPYNPYDPKPYSRWTMRGMLDIENEVKVAEEFWDFLGGNGTYKALLDVFENVGIDLRHEIDEQFAKFRV
ncbi:MAG TPA: TdeIII family type II restriction endonuclease [Turneriella sp.]|nr:TdeIII family type II restriction endonuclease [Turneriella sp.]